MLICLLTHLFSADHPVSYLTRHLEEGNMFAYLSVFTGFLAALMALCGIVSV